MVSKGIIRSSDSNWSSPLLMKLKSDKTWRCCGDYRKLNAITKKDEYPVPLIRDITTRLAEAKFFTKLDLEKAYYQIKMAEEDIKNSNINTFRAIRILKNAIRPQKRSIDIPKTYGLPPIKIRLRGSIPR